MISPFAGFTIVVVASKNLPVKSLKELIEYAKANPGKLNYGSVGIGSSQHLAGEYFGQVTGTKIGHVPYRNIAQYGPDLIAGIVPLGFQWYPNVAGADRHRRRHSAGGRRRQAHPGAAGHADHHRGGPARIQGQRLVRDAGARRHAEADPREAQQGSDRGAQRSRREGGLREGRRRNRSRCRSTQAKKFHADEIEKYRDIITKAGIAKIE